MQEGERKHGCRGALRRSLRARHTADRRGLWNGDGADETGRANGGYAGGLHLADAEALEQAARSFHLGQFGHLTGRINDRVLELTPLALGGGSNCALKLKFQKLILHRGLVSTFTIHCFPVGLSR